MVGRSGSLVIPWNHLVASESEARHDCTEGGNWVKLVQVIPDSCLTQVNINSNNLLIFYSTLLQLAGGLLTGRYKYEDTEEKKPYGRFFGVGGKWAES